MEATSAATSLRFIAVSRRASMMRWAHSMRRRVRCWRRCSTTSRKREPPRRREAAGVSPACCGAFLVRWRSSTWIAGIRPSINFSPLWVSIVGEMSQDWPVLALGGSGGEGGQVDAPLHEVRVYLSTAEERVIQDYQVKRDGGGHPGNLELHQGPPHARDGLIAVRAPGDHLGQQGIVVRGDRIARVGMGIDPHAWTSGTHEGGHRAGGGPEVMPGILGVDAAFDGVAANLHVALVDAQLLPGGHFYLQLHDVSAGDHLRHRVLHLDAGAHLHEIKVTVAIHQALHGARTRAIDSMRSPDRRLAQGADEAFPHARRRRPLQHLLMAALNRTIARAEVDDIVMPVGQDLHLDVARFGNVLLQVELPAAERGFGFRL